MRAHRNHFKWAIAVAAAFYFSKGPLIMDVRSPAWAVWLLSSRRYKGQSIYSCPFPEPQQPDSPTLRQRARTKGIFCTKRVQKKVCVHVCEWEYIKVEAKRKSVHASGWMALCVSVLLSASVCLICCIPPLDWRGIPTRYYATVLCKTLLCTKEPFHARLFRNLYIKKMGLGG